MSEAGSRPFRPPSPGWGARSSSSPPRRGRILLSYFLVPSPLQQILVRNTTAVANSRTPQPGGPLAPLAPKRCARWNAPASRTLKGRPVACGAWHAHRASPTCLLPRARAALGKRLQERTPGRACPATRARASCVTAAGGRTGPRSGLRQAEAGPPEGGGVGWPGALPSGAPAFRAV